LNSWVGKFGYFVKTSKTIEDKWLLLGLLNNTTESCTLLLVFLYYQIRRTKLFVGSFSSWESRL